MGIPSRFGWMGDLSPNTWQTRPPSPSWARSLSGRTDPKWSTRTGKPNPELVIVAKRCVPQVRLVHLDVEDCSGELFRQQSYAIKNQFGHPKPPVNAKYRGYFACPSMILYGTRAFIIAPFCAWKPTVPTMSQRTSEEHGGKYFAFQSL